MLVLNLIGAGRNRLELLKVCWLLLRFSKQCLNRKTKRHMWHAIDSTPITAFEISFNWLRLTYWPFKKPLSLFWNIRSVIYRGRAFLKHLPKNNLAILPTDRPRRSVLRCSVFFYIRLGFDGNGSAQCIFASMFRHSDVRLRHQISGMKGLNQWISVLFFRHVVRLSHQIWWRKG